jgi:type II secretory pathway component PulJ
MSAMQKMIAIEILAQKSMLGWRAFEMLMTDNEHSFRRMRLLAAAMPEAIA